MGTKPRWERITIKIEAQFESKNHALAFEFDPHAVAELLQTKFGGRMEEIRRKCQDPMIPAEHRAPLEKDMTTQLLREAALLLLAEPMNQAAIGWAKEAVKASENPEIGGLPRFMAHVMIPSDPLTADQMHVKLERLLRERLPLPGD